VNEKEPMARNIAMVFQNYALYPHMSVAENMGYGLKVAGKPRAEIATRVAAAAKLLQLEPYLGRKPRELSGGQRQRVAMGRAIVREPDVFLFDEPLSNHDAKLRVQMRLEIRQLQRKLGITALYVTHDQVEAMTLADRMIVMNEGRAEQIGAPLEVYENPATTFVAGFIGSPPMNFLSGEVLPALPPTTVLGVRAEHLHLVPASAGRIAATVLYAEALGAETLVHLRLADGGVATARIGGSGRAPAEGSATGLGWAEAHALLFGPDGRRVPPR
jgi:sn-glycerol 3-phosphate transport system ATP-binding protein